MQEDLDTQIEFNSQESLINEALPETERIAIDGPVASGKGTVAQLVSEMLGFLNVDTGAMYRTVALISAEKGIDVSDEERLVQEILDVVLDQRLPTEEEKIDERRLTVLLDGKDITREIRTPEVDARVYQVSQHPRVRAELVRQQQEIAKGQNVVMEGRDITHTVLPNAQVKIYLDANLEERAQRRYQEYIRKGKNPAFKDVLDEIVRRDKTDQEKNLRIEPDAWYIDCSNLTSEQVATMIVNKLWVNRTIRFYQMEAGSMGL